MSNNDLKAVLPPDGNLDFELVGHSARAGRMPVHSFKIRTTLESGERIDITEHVGMTLGKKLNRDDALNESGMGYYKPDAIAGSLAEALYDQDRYNHTFKVREEAEVSESAKSRHEQIIGLRTAVDRSNLDQVDTLLNQGADPNIPDQYGRTALHLVSNEEVAQRLLDAGADIDAKDGWGETPLEANLYSGPQQVLRSAQSASRREDLHQIAATSRPSQDNDLATPEQALAARQAKYGRGM